MKRAELNDKIKSGLTIDEDHIIVQNGKNKQVLELSGAEFDLESGKVMMKYLVPAKTRQSRTQTVQSKGGKK